MREEQDARRRSNATRRFGAIRLSFVACLVTSLILALPSQLMAGPPAPVALADLKALEAAFVRIADQVRPSVVTIRTYLHRRGTSDKGGPAFRSARMRPRTQGTGMIISADGFILTNQHVVQGADEVIVILHDGREETAEVVQDDIRNDLAVLTIDARHLKPVRFRDVGDVRVGQWTLAVGNPFGMANFNGRSSVTVGTVSAFGRDLTYLLTRGSNDDRYYGNLLETSATINPGNSGGPLFNIDGEVIGIITAIETRTGVSEGVGFAIPLDRYIRRIIETLVSGEKVRYGHLGVEITTPNPRTLRDVGLIGFRGAFVTKVMAGQPAARAGLRRNDLIIAFNGDLVESSDDLIRLVGLTPAGTPSNVKFVRDGKEMIKRVVLTNRPSAFIEPPPDKRQD